MRPSLRLPVLLVGTALLSGCMSGFSKPEGVMPAGDVAPPPGLRGTDAGRSIAAAAAKENRAEAPSPAARTSRNLSVPSNVRGATDPGAPSTRRIRREDLEDDGTGGGGSRSGSMGPTLSPTGGVGLGGKF